MSGRVGKEKENRNGERRDSEKEARRVAYPKPPRTTFVCHFWLWRQRGSVCAKRVSSAPCCRQRDDGRSFQEEEVFKYASQRKSCLFFVVFF